jgi:Translation initiation factor IF-2, N-terminal region
MPVEPRGTAHLRERLHDLAWSVADDDLREAGPHTARTERQARYLAVLAVYTRMLTSLQANIDSAVAGAYAEGATFAEIGRAAGMSRQAARQKWLHLTSKPAATNSGDPRHGERDIAHADIVSEEQICQDGKRDEEVTALSRYTEEHDNPQIHEFLGYDGASRWPAGMPSPVAEPTSRPDSHPLLPWPPPPPPLSPGDTKPRVHELRVHELAAELGLTSKQVLRDLARMGEYVKSASSRLEPTVARKLRLMHQPPR